MALTTTNDVHEQFANFFREATLQPFVYLLSKRLAEGNICVSLADFSPEQVEALKRNPFVSTDIADVQPFVLFNNRLYFHRYFHYEGKVVQQIEQLIDQEKKEVAARKELLLSQKEFVESKLSRPLQPAAAPDWQQAAVVSAAINNFTIITGGPGTGKTTTVAKILAILFKLNPGLKVALAAPTGKAAARMVDSLKSAALSLSDELASALQSLKPNTLHRLLGSIPHSPNFLHNKENPLPYDLLIVDESSMIGVALFAKLLDAISPDTRLILLGDKDQLASVEAGSLFGDLCLSQPVLNVFEKDRFELINALHGSLPAEAQVEPGGATHPLFQHIVELKFSYRFEDTGGIGLLSKAVIQNDFEKVQSFLHDDTKDDQVVIDQHYSASLFERLAMEYKKYIEEPDPKIALQKMNAFKILCAIREGEFGVQQLNRRVERLLNDSGILKIEGEFYENRPIIVTKNNYALNLFNGDMGLIRPDEQGVMKAWFEDAEGKLRGITPGLIGGIETVFAMTIHKSQGSEFDQVLLVLPTFEQLPILTRELIYTGITRAKNKVFIQGTEEVLKLASERKVQRASGIAERFTNLN